jgi:saccharopepsin
LDAFQYGVGWASGTIAYADVVFSGVTVQNQSFLDTTNAQSPALAYDADGILGLGFTSLSGIDATLNKTGQSTGRSLLYNLFLQNPKEPNFVSFALQRSQQPGDDVQGAFSIGVFDPQYTNVQQMPPIPTWPELTPSRWTVLLDALLIGNTTTLIPTTTVPDVPNNKAVILIDTGTSYTYAPVDVCKAIYGNIPGAQFDSSSGTWTVPCATEIDIALQIGGQIFPFHPLDVSPISLTDPNSCTGSFLSTPLSVAVGEIDWIVGANFLRSVYSVFDFGDFDTSGKMGAPYLKLLSLVDPDVASQEFHTLRGGQPLSGIVYQPVDSAGSSSTGGTTTITLGSDVANILDKVGKYFPAMLGVMALNAIVLLALVVVGIIHLTRKRKARATPRRLPGRMSPMPLTGLNSTYVESAYGSPSSVPHSYQPVSMALTDDTFVPPSPAFHSSDGKGGRPKSVA